MSDTASPGQINPRVLPDSPVWTDRRLTSVNHNEFAHAAGIPASAEDLALHRQWVRKRILLAAGLQPMPARPRVEAQVWGWFSHEGVTIGKVAFEALPSLKVTGNLYLPGHVNGPLSGVLCPHGHWTRGRVHHEDRGSVPLRCLMLARLGFAVFSYDMVGYNDSNGIPHRWSPRDSRMAALFGVSPFGLHLWNSLRALDFFAALPEVDARRIGCTGASGGASQTWNLAVVDERIRVIAPVCMLSSHFQGGCPCEEGPLLRLDGLTSADVLAALAPRPLLLPSVSGDWTNLNPTYELEAVREAYSLLDAEDRVKGVHFHDGHNYNRRTREHVYPWFVRWLQTVDSVNDTIDEPDLTPPAPDKLRHSTDQTPPSPEQTATRLRTLQRLAAAAILPTPTDVASLRATRQLVRQLYADILGARAPSDVAVRVTFGQTTRSECTVSGRVISRRDQGDVVPALLISPRHGENCQGATLVVMPEGKADLFPEGAPSPLCRSLLAQNRDILAIDMLGTGDTASMLKRDCREPDNPVDWAFNPSLLSMRVQDVLTALAVLRQNGYRDIDVVAGGEAARVALLALSLTSPVNAAHLDLEGVDLTPEGWAEEAFHPHILKLGGLRAALLLAAPTPLTLRRAPRDLREWAKRIYGLLGHEDRLRWRSPLFAQPSGRQSP